MATAAESTLPVALLLSLSGGFLDAFTYVGHGQVFANAMTGNVVLLGVFLAAGNLTRAAAHIPPIIAFMAGVFLAQALRVYIARGVTARAALFSLIVEIATLAALAFLSCGLPNIVIVLTISLVAALQNSSFSRVGGWAYNSVMTTGNLKHFAESLFGAVTRRGGPDAAGEARVFGFVCLGFLAGACLGGLATPWLGDHALILPAMVLSAVLLFCLRPARA